MPIDEDAIKVAGRRIHSWSSNLGEKAARDVIEAYEAAKAQRPVELAAGAKAIPSVVNTGAGVPHLLDIRTRLQFAQACARAWGLEWK